MVPSIWSLQFGMRSLVSLQYFWGILWVLVMFSWNFGSMSSKWIAASKCTPVIRGLSTLCLPLIQVPKEHPASGVLRREVRHLLGRCLWGSDFEWFAFFCQKQSKKNKKQENILSLKLLVLMKTWKPRSNLGRINLPRWIHSIHSGRHGPLVIFVEAGSLPNLSPET